MNHFSPVTGRPVGVQLLEAARHSVVEVMRSICGKTPAARVEAIDTKSTDGLSGMISFAGDHEFTMILAVPKSTCGSLARKFTGVAIDFDSDVMDDVIGELANILAGDLSARLAQEGITAQMRTPSVTRGSDAELLARTEAAERCLHISSAEGDYFLSIVLEPGGSNPPRDSERPSQCL